MVSSFTLESLIQDHPRAYHRLCRWAKKRKVPDPVAEVNTYLTEMLETANDDAKSVACWQKWQPILSGEERHAIAGLLQPPVFDGEELLTHWYDAEPGEYSVVHEPVLHEIRFAGEVQGVITRNHYGCLVLNCDRLLIVDVDILSPENWEFQDCSQSCAVPVSQYQAIAALEALVEGYPELGFRVYHTRNGLRYFCTTQPFDPTNLQTQRLMQNLYVDPLYARLCRFQATFRARLTPKPWRVDSRRYSERFVYDRLTGMVFPEVNPYSVCHLIEIIGSQTIRPEFEPVIELHDAYCRVSRLGLTLA